MGGAHLVVVAMIAVCVSRDRRSLGRDALLLVYELQHLRM
jgi:hypothetical protein